MKFLFTYQGSFGWIVERILLGEGDVRGHPGDDDPALEPKGW